MKHAIRQPYFNSLYRPHLPRSTSCLMRYPFKAYWLRDAPTGLTFNNRTLCPHCIYVLYLFENKQRLVPLTP